VRRTLTLKDGSRIVIRAVEPDDRERIREGFERLSPESRYRRFFGPMPRLRERDLDYLTILDHHDHEALLAIDERTGGGIGVARFVRTDGPTAEPAIVVADEWHGKGVATALLEALAERARKEGISRFDAPILAGNRDAIRVFEQLGPTSITHNGREVELLIDLPDKPAPLAGARAMLKQFASGAVEPARTFLDLVWPRRRGAPGVPRRNVIVVGTDGSDHAAAAVEAAGELAKVSGATVHVVGAHRFFLPERTDVTEAVTQAASTLQHNGAHVHEVLRRGDPAVVLTDVAVEEDASLIVVGAGERSKTTRRLMGNVADLVSERAPCNVLIVRPSPEP
jgi:nucleotide-binding universal stress UspA family protein